MCIYTYIIYDGEPNFLSRCSLHDLDERQSPKSESLPSSDLPVRSPIQVTLLSDVRWGLLCSQLSAAAGEFSRFRRGSKWAVVPDTWAVQQTRWWCANEWAAAVVCVVGAAQVSWRVTLKPAAAGFSKTSKVNSYQLNISSTVWVIMCRVGWCACGLILEGVPNSNFDQDTNDSKACRGFPEAIRANVVVQWYLG